MGEDIVLRRALRHRSPGRYIDVGAHSPVGSSVTKLLHNEGWRGINIEPVRHLYEDLVADRPDDVNLHAGVSDRQGVMRFFDVIEDPQRSTFSTALADHYREVGMQVHSVDVDVVTLDEVFRTHVTGPVDFLKVDVEGHEQAVFRGLDLSTHRPHIIVAESTLDAAGWVDDVLASDYRAALFDGCNQFFVAAEHADELFEALSYPACPLDDYVAYDHLTEVNQVVAQRDALEAHVADLNKHIGALHAELAWRREPRWRRGVRRLRQKVQG